MVLVLLVGLCIAPAQAADDTKAKKLIDLGLMSNLEVERETTRAEMMTLYVKFLGKESEAVSQKNVHPFTDVPDWASNYIGWLFANGITKGIGNNLSGSANLGTAKEYLNLLLKGLEYTDADFSFDTAVDFAISKGLVAAEKAKELESRSFLRGDMADLSFDALSVNLKDKNNTLADKLINSGVIEKSKAQANGVKVQSVDINELFSQTDAGNIPVADGVNCLYADFYKTRNGLCFLTLSNSSVLVTEAYISESGNPFVKLDVATRRTNSNTMNCFDDLLVGRQIDGGIYMCRPEIANLNPDSTYSVSFVIETDGTTARTPIITAKIPTTSAVGYHSPPYSGIDSTFGVYCKYFSCYGTDKSNYQLIKVKPGEKK